MFKVRSNSGHAMILWSKILSFRGVWDIRHKEHLCKVFTWDSRRELESSAGLPATWIPLIPEEDPLSSQERVCRCQPAVFDTTKAFGCTFVCFRNWTPFAETYFCADLMGATEWKAGRWEMGFSLLVDVPSTQVVILLPEERFTMFSNNLWINLSQISDPTLNSSLPCHSC